MHWLIYILTHLAYCVNARQSDISNNNSQFEIARRHTLAEVICDCKMKSIMGLDGVTTFLHLKGIQIHVCDTFQLLAKILQWNGKKLEVAEDLNAFSTFNVC